MSTTVNVRMYNQENLGDCFLLHFTGKGEECYYLIDFGSYESGNNKRELQIAQHIADTVKEVPLRIILTHQHKDHLSGFISGASVFSQMRNIEEVWFSYLDDPQGKEAIAIRNVTEKFWKKNKDNKRAVKKKFGRVSAVSRMMAAKQSFDQFAEEIHAPEPKKDGLLAEEQKGGQAITNLLAWSKNRKQFLTPGKSFDLPGLPPGLVKVYVLGPPLDDTLLRKLNPGKGEEVQGLNATMQLMNLDTSVQLMADALNAITPDTPTTEENDNFPFNKKFGTKFKEYHPLKGAYQSSKEQWRRIDHEWLSEIGRVSLHMDTLTNNSSLVLAFELVESGKVLLFAGDAQIGNWKSWANLAFQGTDIKGNDLLARTVFYKAGHHSSTNATLADSLELMNTEELVIMIPVNEIVSTKRKFHMLKPGMMMGYNRKTQGRVLRSDTIIHDEGSAKYFQYKFKKQKEFGAKLKIIKDATGNKHLGLEYKVQ